MDYKYRTRTIKLMPTPQQKAMLCRFAGIARYLYNFYIDEEKRRYQLYKTGSNPKPAKMTELHNAYKKLVSTPGNEWIKEVPAAFGSTTLIQFQTARNNAIRGKTPGFPAYKKRGRDECFAMPEFLRTRLRPNQTITLKKHVHIKMAEPFDLPYRVFLYSIIKHGDDWYVAITYKMPGDYQLPCKDPSSAVGIDIGIHTAITLSSGKTYKIPSTEKLEKQLVFHRQRLRHTKVGSNRHQKCLTKIHRLGERIRNTIYDSLHKATTEIAKNHGIAVMETLDVQDMIDRAPVREQKRMFYKARLKVIQQMLYYKMREVYRVDKYFPSTQRCSKCWHMSPMPWKQRVYKCPECGARIDRDLNAANNLLQEYFAGRVAPLESR